MSDQTILDRLKPHSTSIASTVATLVLAGVIAFGNFRATSAHTTDVQAGQEDEIKKQGQQINSLQEQLNHQALILSAVSEFKDDTQTRLNRIEGKIDKLRDGR